jgi:ABC-type phosphate transport system ATPase subunit
MSPGFLENKILDGFDLRQLDLLSLHHHISTVSQVPTLFNASLADNIGYGAVTSQYSMENPEPVPETRNPKPETRVATHRLGAATSQ